MRDIEIGEASQMSTVFLVEYFGGLESEKAGGQNKTGVKVILMTHDYHRAIYINQVKD